MPPLLLQASGRRPSTRELDDAAGTEQETAAPTFCSLARRSHRPRILAAAIEKRLLDAMLLAVPSSDPAH